jgi:adenylate cyclase
VGEERTKRKLAAILSADVKGYSRLMADNEEATVQTINAYREAMTNLILAHNGRVVDAKGDNVLADFSSVVDAVRCSIEVQEELTGRNTDLPEHRRMEFRIGVNLGDVIEEGETIYGDGVNVAARLEGLAQGGGICISGTAYDQVRDKLGLGYEYLGEQSVKNIPRPVRAYKVLLGPKYAGKMIGEKRVKSGRWEAIGGLLVIVFVLGALAVWYAYFRSPPIERAAKEKMAFPLPGKPSIAVLPFDNLSEDPKQEFLSDGLTEELITSLSRSQRIFVIARNSVFTYKGKPIKVQRVSEDLGVRYVLEGSVRRSGDRVRITAQLIDALGGHHLWAERYERDLKDFFALQDDIAMKIMSSLQVKLTDGEQALLYEKGTDNLDAYLKCLQGLEQVYRFSKEGLDQARPYLEKAIKLDPHYAAPYRWLGGTHLLEVILGVSKSPKQSVMQAMKHAKKAIALDDTFAPAHCLLSHLYSMIGKHEKAIAQARRAVSANPNAADSHAYLAMALTFGGRPEEAVPLFKKAIRLNPIPPKNYLYILSLAYRYTGQYDKAIPLAKELLSRDPNDIMARQILAVSYGLAGREKEARIEVEELLKRRPRYSLERVAKMGFPSKHRSAQAPLVLQALRKAGMPEHPPLPLPEKPSIAVLPFTNMSGDTGQEYFSDGITDNIITALSKVEKLFVIARNSSFVYKGKAVKVQRVAKDLGVQYVLEGSVQKSAGRIRITAQFVDAQKGHHLWAERYDRELKDLFALQDEITMKIITALEVKLTEGEQALVTGSGTTNLDAYLKILQARDLKRHQNIQNNHKARKLAEAAIKLDPDYAQAYRWLSGTYVMDVWLGSSKSPQESLRTAMKLAKKALSLDESLGASHGLLGNIYIMMREYEKGIEEAKRAVELEPNGADAHAFLGMGLRFADRGEEAVPILKKAIRLDPHAPQWYLHVLAGAYRNIDRYKEAMEWGEKAVRKNPNNALSRVILCSIYSLAGQMEKARVQAKEIMKLNPHISLDGIARTDPQKNQAIKKRNLDALRKAGLK